MANPRLDWSVVDNDNIDDLNCEIVENCNRARLKVAFKASKYYFSKADITTTL